MSRSELVETDSPATDFPAADQAAAADRAAAEPGGALADRETTARANALALAYQAGQSEALPALFDLLRPLLRASLQRYAVGSLGLPPSIDKEDLQQQSWIILDALARRWSPDGGDFPAYVRSTFLWELWRYVRSLSPGKRARTVRVDNVQHDVLLDRIGDRAGTDGRRWDDQLIAAEMLNELDEMARRAFLLHLMEDRSFEDVAHALRLTLAGAYRAYRRALDQLRLRAGLELDPDDALARRTGRPTVGRAAGDGVARGGRPRGRLPGRAIVCARANVSEVRFARLMGLLVTRGCIVERSARKPGRLVYATPEETLAHLRHQPNE